MRMLLYNLLLPLVKLTGRVLARNNRKIARSFEARKDIRKRWAERLEAADEGLSTVWFHVSSAGEFLQARPVMDLLSEKYHGRIRIALTFYSPSGFDYYMKHDRARRNRSIFFVDYLPFDTPGDMRFCFDALSPDVIVYTKYEIWPNLVSTAARRGVRQVLLSAAVSGDSRMFSGAARWFFRPLYRAMDRIGAVSDEDSRRLAAFTGDRSRITVTGDVRFDQVVRRIDSPTAEIPRALRDDPRSIIIAGSTWPRDEEIVIPGFRELKQRSPDTLLVIAPHEPAPERVSQIMASLKREGMSGEALSGIEEKGPVKADVVIADGIGYLAELYTACDIAYVGGSWTSGIHNVLEPAVAGLPVFFGPKFGNAWEAGVLIEIGAAFPVTGPTDFAEKTLSLLSDRPALRKAGRAASDYIRNNTGASTRSLELIEDILWPVKD